VSQGHFIHAAGPVLYQSCQLSWSPNADSNVAGYRAYFGQLSTQLTQVKDVGNQTSVSCSDANVAANGQWYAAVTAYNVQGVESSLSQVVQFQLTGLAAPAPLPNLSEPTSVQLTVSPQGFQLTWADGNTPPIAHRIEVSTSVQPTWTAAAVLPPNVNSFSSFQPAGALWACYRLRGESGSVVSDWAEATGPTDRQFCFAPAQIPSIAQPIVASTVVYEPQSVQLTPRQPGFVLAWTDPTTSSTAVHRIEISSSTSTQWTSLAVVPAATNSYTYAFPLDASWVCLRIRTEVGQAVSLWAMATGPTDRQFCYAPTAVTATSAPMAGNNPSGGNTGSNSNSSTVSTGVGLTPQPSTALSVSQSSVPGIISPDSIAEPTDVQKTPVGSGIELQWMDPSLVPASHRIEASSSIQPIWTLASIVPPGVKTFFYTAAVNSDWACLRIRAELQGMATLWAMASGPTDRQFCYKPGPS
jgi:hypothetical protein